jgi:hypothetical protein
MSFEIGQRVRVRDQDITGKIIRFDWNGDVVIVDDDVTDDDSDDGEMILVYRPEDLIPVMGDDFFGNCSNCVDW